MSSIPKALAKGLAIHQNERVERLERHGDHWLAKTEANTWKAERVVLTVPFPQVAPIIEKLIPCLPSLRTLSLSHA